MTQDEGTTGRHVIGWTELVSFPDWKVPRIQAKIDTGARTSALHVENLERIGPDRVAFDVIVGRRRNQKAHPIEAGVVRWATVKSSSGETTERPFVKIRIQIGPVEKEVEVSLVSRERMLFRMLLGRKALEKDFLVDVSRRRILTAPKLKASPDR